VAGRSNTTVWVAFWANMAIAALKIAGAAATGSAALFAEAAHSVSDTLNETFLLVSLRSTRRPPDADHPFGYGKEQFFWSLLAAVGILITGAGFSGVEAYRAFSGREHVGAHYFAISYAVLAGALVAEGTSWWRAVRQLRAEAHAARRTLMQHVRLSPDPSVKTVVGEDSAAVLGNVLAAGGIAVHQVAGGAWAEGIAALAIAVLLVVTALLLANDVKSLLIGEAADEQVRNELFDFLSEREAVDAVLQVLTMRLGAHDLLLAARVDLDSGLRSDAVESVSAEIDHAITERWPEVRYVFLDATRSAERARRPRHGGTDAGWDRFS